MGPFDCKYLDVQLVSSRIVPTLIGVSRRSSTSNKPELKFDTRLKFRRGAHKKDSVSDFPLSVTTVREEYLLLTSCSRYTYIMFV